MNYTQSVKKILVVALASLALTACATQSKKSGKMSGDVYTGNDTVDDGNSLLNALIFGG